MGESPNQLPLTSKEKNTSRNIILDVAKGLLILFMVVGHAGAPSWLVNSIYSFHMPCFFMISGILFSYAYLDKPWTFIKKRVKSIWWPFVKWTWIFLLLHNLFFNLGIYENSYSFDQILYKIFKIFFLLEVEQLLGGFWFLRALFLASIFCLFYYKLFGISRKSLVIGIGITVALAELITVFDFEFAYIERTNILACSYFMAGTLLNTIKVKGRKMKNFLIITGVLLIAFSGIGEKVEMGTLNKLNLIPYFIKSVMISWGFILILENFQYKSWVKYLCYLGEKTMDILVLHFLAFRMISLIKIGIFGMDIENLKKFPIIEDNNSIFWIVYVILGIIICLGYSKAKDYIETAISAWRTRKMSDTLI